MTLEVGTLATRMEAGFIEANREAAARQTALETVMAQMAEEAEAASAALGSKVDELQAMLEDEVQGMEEMVGDRLAQAKEETDAKLQVGAGRGGRGQGAGGRGVTRCARMRCGRMNRVHAWSRSGAAAQVERLWRCTARHAAAE